jgi:drug/metabolite transporter (DMT)-like permease
MGRKTHGLLVIHFAVLLFGLSGLFAKFVALSPLVIVLGRTFFASLSLGTILISLKRPMRIHSKTDFAAFLLLGGVLAVHWTTFFHAIQISTVAVGLLSFSTFPVFVTFMEPHFFKEKLRLFDVLTAILVFCGLILVIPSLDFDNPVTRGAFWGIVSGLTFALLSILNRKYVRKYAPSVIAFYQNAVASLALVPFVSLGATVPTPKDVLQLALLGILCTALAHALFIKGLQHVRAQLASVTACLEPVYGVFFALLLLGEIPAPRTAIGGLIIVGTTLVAGAGRRANS